MYGGNQRSLYTDDIQGAQPKIRRQRGHHSDIDYAANPFLYSKKQANDIYSKNHPNSHNNLFGALETEEAIKNQFTRKNNEYATIDSYGDYFKEQAVLQHELEQRYGKKMGIEDLSHFLDDKKGGPRGQPQKKQSRGQIADSLDNFRNNMEQKIDPSLQNDAYRFYGDQTGEITYNKQMGESLSKDAFKFFGMDPPASRSEEMRQYKDDFYRMKESTGKVNHTGRSDADIKRIKDNILNDPQYKMALAEFYGDEDELKKMNNFGKQPQEPRVTVNQRQTPQQRQYQEQENNQNYGSNPYNNKQYMAQNSVPGHQRGYSDALEQQMYSYQKNQKSQMIRDNEQPSYITDHYKANNRGFYDYTDNNPHFNNSTDKMLKGDGEMKLHRRGRQENNGVLYSHQPIQARQNARLVPSNADSYNLPANQLYGSGIPVLY